MLKNIRRIGYLLVLACLPTVSSCNMEEPISDVNAVGKMSSELYGTADAVVYVDNGTSTTMELDSANYNGYFNPPYYPASTIDAGGNDLFWHVGTGNIVSGHFDYSAGSKSCRFDYSSYPDIYGNCVFNKSAKSTGYTYASCTATITWVDYNTCSMDVVLTLQ